MTAPAIGSGVIIEPTGSTSANHDGSHRRLLTEIDTVPAPDTEVQAIIVPTARPETYLHPAIGLAAELDCALVLLCSRSAAAEKAADMARRAGVTFAAITIDAAGRLLPRFETTKLLSRAGLGITGDVSPKRNLGLLLGRLAGWDRAVFLDDDIVVPNPADLRSAVRHLDEFDGVGLENTGYPDNSVVCHAFRAVGGRQDTFIGTGALAVSCSRTDAFFPKIYNEDWLFLLDEDGLRPTAITGEIVQERYNPFAHKRRARFEEFGECLAEGLFWLLDEGYRPRDADRHFWQGFLTKRKRFINEILERLASRSPALGGDLAASGPERMMVALQAALDQHKLITPELCLRYLAAWQDDRERWRSHLAATEATVLGTGLASGERPSITDLLLALGLPDHSAHLAGARQSRTITVQPPAGYPPPLPTSSGAPGAPGARALTNTSQSST